MRSKWLLLSVPCFVIVWSGCATEESSLQRLVPTSQTSPAPSQCRLIEVIPSSPAERDGLRVGDVIKEVNGMVPKDASAVVDLIRQSPSTLSLDIQRGSEPLRHLTIQLNDKKPRLGAACDLTGWSQRGVTAAGNESITLFRGPLSLTVSGVIDKMVTLIRIEVINHSSAPVDIDPSQIQVEDSAHHPLHPYSPREYLVLMHGEEGGKYLDMLQHKVIPAAQAPAQTSLSQDVQSRIAYEQADAEFTQKESLWPGKVLPGQEVSGLVYFSKPQSLPLIVHVSLEGQPMIASLGATKAVVNAQPRQDISHYLNHLEKGKAIRVSLKNGKAIVGRFSSYDSLNETLWMQSEESTLLNVVSFGLGRIAAVQALNEEEPSTKTLPTN